MQLRPFAASRGRRDHQRQAAMAATMRKARRASGVLCRELRPVMFTATATGFGSAHELGA